MLYQRITEMRIRQWQLDLYKIELVEVDGELLMAPINLIDVDR